MSHDTLIIVLHWQDAEKTKACLDSLLDLNASADILVIDNGSTNDSAEMLQSAFPQVAFLHSSENLGYAGGNNLGLQRALDENYTYAWILNNDVTVLPDTLEPLIDAMEHHPKLGMVGSLVRHPEHPEIIDFLTGTFNESTQQHDFFAKGWTLDHEALQSLPQLMPADWLCGCGLLVRTSALTDVGLLDPNYFLYYEDLDWSRRFVQQGWQLASAPASQLWHHSQTPIILSEKKQRHYYGIRNRHYFLSKQPGTTKIRLLHQELREIWNDLFRKEPPLIKMHLWHAHLSALKDACLLRKSLSQKA